MPSPTAFLLLLCLVCGAVAISVYSDDSSLRVDANSNGTGKFQHASGLTFVDVVQFTATEVDFKKSTWLNTGVLGSLKDGNLDISGTPITVTATTGNISFKATDATKKAGLWANNVESLVASSSGMTVPIAVVDSVSWTTGSLTLSSTAGSVQFYSQSATNEASFSLKGAAVLKVTKEQLEFQNTLTWSPVGAVTAKPDVAAKSVIAKNGTTTMTINNTNITFSSTPSAAGIAEKLESQTAATVLALKGQTGVDFNAVKATTGAINITKATAGAKVSQFTGEEDLILAAGATKAVVVSIGGVTHATIESKKLSLEGTTSKVVGAGALTVQSGGTGDLKFTTTLASGQLDLGGPSIVAELKAASVDFKTTKFTLTGTNALDIKGNLVITPAATFKGGVALGTASKAGLMTTTAAATVSATNDLTVTGATVALQSNSITTAEVAAAGITVQAALTTTANVASTFKGATTVAGVVTVDAGKKFTSTGAQVVATDTGALAFSPAGKFSLDVAGTTGALLATNTAVTFASPFEIAGTGEATFGGTVSGVTLNASDVTYAGSKVTATGATLSLKSIAGTTELGGSDVVVAVAGTTALTFSATAVTVAANLDAKSIDATSEIRTGIQLAVGQPVSALGGYTFKTNAAGSLTIGSVGTGSTLFNENNLTFLTMKSTGVTATAAHTLTAAAGKVVTVTGDLTVTGGKLAVGDAGFTASKITSTNVELKFESKGATVSKLTASTAIKLVQGATNVEFTSSKATFTGALSVSAAGKTVKVTGALNVVGATKITGDITMTGKNLVFTKDATISSKNTLKVTTTGALTATAVGSASKMEFKSGAGTASIITLDNTGISLLFPAATNGIVFTKKLYAILHATTPAQALSYAISGNQVSILDATTPTITGVNSSSGCFCAFATASDKVSCSCRINGTSVVSYAIYHGPTAAVAAYNTGGANYVAIVPEAL